VGGRDGPSALVGVRTKGFLGSPASRGENHQRPPPPLYFFGSSARCPGVIGTDDAEFLATLMPFAASGSDNNEIVGGHGAVPPREDVRLQCACPSSATRAAKP